MNRSSPGPSATTRSRPSWGAERFDTDRDLVAAMLVDDPAAWREFQSKHDDGILRSIVRITRRFPAVCPEEVREIAAKLYLSLLANDKHKLRAFDPSLGPLAAWISLLAVHLAYDHLRLLAREPPKEHIAAAMDVPAELADPIDRASERERAVLVDKTLDQLSERDRTFARLYFREGMAPQDIATEMNVSIKTIYSKKHKLLFRLQSSLAAPDSH